MREGAKRRIKAHLVKASLFFYMVFSFNSLALGNARLGNNATDQQIDDWINSFLADNDGARKKGGGKASLSAPPSQSEFENLFRDYFNLLMHRSTTGEPTPDLLAALERNDPLVRIG